MRGSIICPICGYEMEVDESIEDGEVVVCPKCGAELKLTFSDGEILVDVV